jgi:preprotein translocase subunit YajC
MSDADHGQTAPFPGASGEHEEHDMSTHDEDGVTTGSDRTSGVDPFATLDKRRRGVRVTYAAAVALGLAIGGGAIAGAASGSTSTAPPSNSAGGPAGHFGFGGAPPAAFGTVASVGADTFVVTTIDGTKVTVDVSGTTTYVDPGVTTPSFTDVKVGDHVAVFGTDSSNTVTANKVALGGPDGGGPGGFGGHRGFGGTPPAAVGTVASVGTNTFVVTSPDGTKVTVDVGSSTSYMEFGKTSASIADVTVGAHVAVFGTNANNTVTATTVGIGNPTARPGGPWGGPGRPGGPWGPGGNHGPDGMGGWPPAPSGTAGSSGTASGSSGTASSSSGTATSSGGTLN